MTDPAAYVSAELEGVVHPVGQLWVTGEADGERATFEYDDSWLASKHRYALEPALALARGPFHTRAGQAMFGALGDSAPDGWGRHVITRDERLRAKAEQREPRVLRETDYLLAVTDETRQGALRFATSRERSMAVDRDISAVPRLKALPKLLAAAYKVLDDEESAQDLRLLLGASSPLGGERPKATVRDADGSLLIAKFPARGDPHRIVEWEAVALSLAQKAGLTVLGWRLAGAAVRRVLLVRRFDRSDGTRVPFLSAMSALDATDGQPRSYVEIAEFIRASGASVAEDLEELWRRIVFTVLISNTDDHLRNQGFLYAGQRGWRLSPAYDLNPVPGHIRPRVLATAISDNGDFNTSLETAVGVAARFDVTAARARTIIAEVAGAVQQWRTEAVAMKLKPRSIERMASAFEHRDAVLAKQMA